MLLQMNSNSLVTELKQKQTNKQPNKIYLIKDWVSKLNYKIEFFVLYNGRQYILLEYIPEDWMCPVLLNNLSVGIFLKTIQSDKKGMLILVKC